MPCALESCHFRGRRGLALRNFTFLRGGAGLALWNLTFLGVEGALRFVTPYIFAV